MRTLMLGWEYPPHIAGGLGTACHALTRALAAQGEDLLFVVPHRHGDEPSRHMRLCGANDAGTAPAGRLRTQRVASDLQPYGHGSAGGAGGGLREAVARYGEAVARLAARARYDLVHAHDWMTFAAGAQAARRAGVPFVAHVHSLEEDRSPGAPDPWIAAVEHEALAHADRVLCVSEASAARVAATGALAATRIAVVRNALPALPRGRRPGRRGRAPVVLSLGRVTAQKGPFVLLEAARRVVAADPRVRFVVAGDGDLLPPAIERSATLGLARHVHFTGFLAGREVERAFAEADVFVMPSLREPFGLVALEAAARGLPVVLTEPAGVREVLPSALAVPAGDARALARRLLEVLRRPALRARLSRQGRREARARRWPAVAREVRAAWAEARA